MEENKMAVVHLRNEDGSAKCGCNVWKVHEKDENGNRIEVRKIMRRFLYFENKEKGLHATCKRCLNQVTRETSVLVPDDDLTGKVFHRSFGYDMTINVYARPIKKTAKGLWCQEVKANIDQGAWSPGGGKSSAGTTFDDNHKPFLMQKKSRPGMSGNPFIYWTGDGHDWWVSDETTTHYENHWD